MGKKKMKIKKISLSGFGYTELSPISNSSIENAIISKKNQSKSDIADAYSEMMFLDSCVDEEIAKLLSEIEAQYKKNTNAIRNYYTQRASNKKELEILLDNLEMQIPIAEEEFKIAQEIYNANNPISIDKEDKKKGE